MPPEVGGGGAGTPPAAAAQCGNRPAGQQNPQPAWRGGALMGTHGALCGAARRPWRASMAGWGWEDSLAAPLTAA